MKELKPFSDLSSSTGDLQATDMDRVPSFHSLHVSTVHLEDIQVGHGVVLVVTGRNIWKPPGSFEELITHRSNEKLIYESK